VPLRTGEQRHRDGGEGGQADPDPAHLWVIGVGEGTYRLNANVGGENVEADGDHLLRPEAVRALRERLLPLATVVTPNIPEARALTGAGEGDSQEELARRVVALGAGAAVVTGGHSEEVVDLFFDGSQVVAIEGRRHPDGASHGSGCTHSSALAANLALGATPLEAARRARQVASAAVAAGLREIGSGAGPVDVFDLSAARRADTEAPR